VKKLIVFIMILTLPASVFARKPLPSIYNTQHLLTKLTILHVINKYVDPKRIKPSKMLLSGLEAVARSTPEVMIKKSKNKIIIQVGNKIKKIDSHVYSPWSLISEISDIFKFLEKNLPKDVKRDILEHKLIRGILETLDPHTAFMAPKYVKEMRIHTQGAFGGLGIVVSMCSGKLSVLKVMGGTPAARAKLKPGDRILQIGKQPTENLSLTEAVKILRGEEGTPVSVLIGRKGKIYKRISITREIISYDSVSSRTLGKGKNKVGYIKIKSFQTPTAKQVKMAITKLKAAKVKGLILDLRNNGGGLLKSAIDISNMFIDSGIIVSSVAKNGSKRREFRADYSSTIFKKPLIVLLNSGSASASEIVAGTLKYSNRALIVGEKSFGKGSVQDIIFLLSNSALKLTIAQYLTYGDVSIQGRGITPDIKVHDVKLNLKNRGRKTIYFTSGYETSKESSLKQSLSAAKKGRNDKIYYNLYTLAVNPKAPPFKCKYCGINPDDFIYGNVESFLEDGHIQVSKAIFKKLNGKIYSRKSMIKKIKKTIKKFKIKSDKKIAKAIKKLFKINWKKGVSTKPSVQVTIQPLKSSYEALGWAKVSVIVKNTGKNPVYRLHGVVKSSNPRFNFQEILIGSLNPGKTIKKIIEVRVPKGIASRSDKIKIQLFSDDKKIKGNASSKINIIRNKLPRLSMKYYFQDTTNHNGIMEKGEIGEFRINVKNVGKTATGDAKVVLKNLTGLEVEMIKTKFNIKNLAPGKEKSFTFKIKALKESGDQPWEFRLIVKDCNYGNNINIPWFVKRSDGGKFTLSKKTYLIKVTTPTFVYDTPWKKTKTIFGKLLKGTIVRTVHILNGHYGFKLKGKDVLYIPIRKVVVVKKGGVNLKGLKILRNYSPPEISLSKFLNYTTKNFINLGGIVKDSDGLRDIYVNISNIKSKVYSKKIFYKSVLSRRKSKSFKSKIKLYPGVNIITISARDNYRADFSKTIIIFKK
jgi:carboxyl-terminal processing protease